jgi:Coiled-coil domain-containing protein 56
MSGTAKDAKRKNILTALVLAVIALAVFIYTMLSLR